MAIEPCHAQSEQRRVDHAGLARAAITSAAPSDRLAAGQIDDHELGRPEHVLATAADLLRLANVQGDREDGVRSARLVVAAGRCSVSDGDGRADAPATWRR